MGGEIAGLPEEGSLTQQRWEEIEDYREADVLTGILSPEARRFVQRLYDLGVPREMRVLTPLDSLPDPKRAFTFCWETVSLTLSRPTGDKAYHFYLECRGAKIHLRSGEGEAELALVASIIASAFPNKGLSWAPDKGRTRYDRGLE